MAAKPWRDEWVLHHWDEIALARPSSRFAAGYRLYVEDDLERLRTYSTESRSRDWITPQAGTTTRNPIYDFVKAGNVSGAYFTYRLRALLSPMSGFLALSVLGPKFTHLGVYVDMRISTYTPKWVNFTFGYAG